MGDDTTFTDSNITTNTPFCTESFNVSGCNLTIDVGYVDWNFPTNKHNIKHRGPNWAYTFEIEKFRKGGALVSTDSEILIRERVILTVPTPPPDAAVQAAILSNASDVRLLGSIREPEMLHNNKVNKSKNLKQEDFLPLIKSLQGSRHFVGIESANNVVNYKREIVFDDAGITAAFPVLAGHSVVGAVPPAAGQPFAGGSDILTLVPPRFQ